MKMTPLDIQQQKFRTSLRGCDPREVNFFLERVADAYEEQERQNHDLKDELLRLEQELKGYRKREESFKKAILGSQNVIEHMKENARKESELIIAEAEVRGEKILNRAHNRLAQLHEDIAELKRQRVQIETEISHIIDSHAKLLQISNEKMEALDQEDDKLKILKQAR
jgi:cell division initiation protein